MNCWYDVDILNERYIKMKITAILVLSSALILSGCMTNQLTKQDPILSANTKKTPQKYTQCLAPKWQELRPSTQMIETETGYQLVASDDFIGTMALAKIDSDGTGGANIKLYAITKGLWGSAGSSCL